MPGQARRVALRAVTAPAVTVASAALAAVAAFASGACGKAAAPVAVANVPAPVRAVRTDADASASSLPAWPPALAAALAGHGAPHGEPIALARGADGHDRWLAFVGGDDVALGAWQVTLTEGAAQIEPVTPWPTGVRVVGGVAYKGSPYVLLESLGVLDQPGGMRGVWTGRPDRPGSAEPSPLSLTGVSEVGEIPARLDAMPPPAASLERNASTLLATLQTASTSTQALGRALSTDGADVAMAWQTIFTRPLGHIDPSAAPDRETGERALGLVRDVLETQACGLDACEAWTDKGRAIVRFASVDGRWAIRQLIEDAPAATVTPGRMPPHEVEATSDVEATTAVLAARAREVRQVLGQAPLQADGGTLGVALTDAAPDSPSLVVREGLAARVFGLDVGPVRAQAEQATWEASFADVDGDGRTDVVLRMKGARADGTPLAWTQAFLAPPPSVQSRSVEPDLASALAIMDAPDAKTAARAAAAPPGRAVTHDEACQLLASATTLAGFRRAAMPDARLLLFLEPGRPTWRPKVVPLAKIAAGDVHSFAAHCGEMKCDKTRPYCSYSIPGDSLHVWFAWNGGHLAIEGVADYSGE